MHVTAHADGTFSVAETPELVRVRNLPRRDWEADARTGEMIATFTGWLQHTPAKCRPLCTCCRYVSALNAPQAHYLNELYASKGKVVVPFRPGAGKTLASLLTPTVLAHAIGPQRTVLVVPASGKSKTLIEARDYAKHWRCGAFQLVSYEFLANPANVDWLEKYAPTLILCDEAHKLKHRSCKAWGRIAKYISAERKAGRWPIFVPFTGSLTGRSIYEFWHYMRVAMGDSAPVPASWDEADLWSKAVDEKVPEDVRVLPGALSTLAPRPAGDMDRVKRTRIQLGARITSTPGIVSTSEDVPPVSLHLHATELELPDAVKDAVALMRHKMELPSGETFENKMDVWRHGRSMGAGLWHKWDPPPPRAWLEARKAWHKFVREFLAHSRKMDSPVHVANAIDRGEIDDGGVLSEWRAIAPTFEPHSVAEWIDDTALEYASRWLRDPEHARGLCWVEYVAFGERLSAATGLPYFSAGARDRTGRLLNTYTGGPAIVSITQREQHNLQYFDANLILTCPPKGDWLEQLISRTVRNGQESPEVDVEFVLTTEESYKCLAQCFKDAAYAQAVTRQPQKLCYGECMDPVIQGLKNGEWQDATA